jgi:hypothetical protein
MRTLLLLLLTAAVALPAPGQSDIDEWRSALAGSWQSAGDAPALHLRIDTTTSTDTLHLHLMQHQAPPGVHRELITCTLHWRTANQIAVAGCPRTTLSRMAPPRDTTLTVHPQSKEGRALRQRVQRLTRNAEQHGDDLSIGEDERVQLVRDP